MIELQEIKLSNQIESKMFHFYPLPKEIQQLVEKDEQDSEQEIPQQIDLPTSKVNDFDCQKIDEQSPSLYQQVNTHLKKEEKSVFSKSFHIEGNTIIYGGNNRQFQQILLNQEIKGEDKRTFCVKINKTKYSSIVIGVVDRCQETHRSSYRSGYAIGYAGYGYIWNGKGKQGEYGEVRTGNWLKDGMEIKLQINRQSSTMGLTLINQKGEKKQGTVISPLLAQSDRELVPYFQMYNAGDSLTWWFE